MSSGVPVWSSTANVLRSTGPGSWSSAWPTSATPAFAASLPDLSSATGWRRWASRSVPPIRTCCRPAPPVGPAIGADRRRTGLSRPDRRRHQPRLLRLGACRPHRYTYLRHPPPVAASRPPRVPLTRDGTPTQTASLYPKWRPRRRAAGGRSCHLLTESALAVLLERGHRGRDVEKRDHHEPGGDRRCLEPEVQVEALGSIINGVEHQASGTDVLGR